MRCLAGNIWRTTQEHIVIPVNCKRVAGAGLALQWKERYPDEVATWQAQAMRPGGIHWLVRTIALATKNDWRHPSKLEWIEIGLLRLALWLEGQQTGVALPMIGCGLGGLDWQHQVWPLVCDILEHYDVDVYGAT